MRDAFSFLARTSFSVGITLFAISAVMAQTPRVLESGKLPNDQRLGPLKTLNDHFPFVVPNNAGEWHARAEALKQRVLVSTGLWPMPEKTPLNAVIHGKSERDGFTIEKVYFQSLPGHYVTGLLFRPSNPAVTPGPAVLSPHGHGGRMQRYTDKEINYQIEIGAEHFKNSGQTPKLARCVQLARMGCVTFIFDMVGYEGSVQISRELAHRHKDARPEEAAGHQDGWIFFSPEADLRLQSIMGLQTWNLVRALDFLASLPDVDPDRLAVTGGSGGGTQSILLGAIDDRIKASFPNGMVSTAMQGGCYCENCNLLRVGTGNVELAALFAPKPQAMTAANDWTKDMMKDGYPELKWLYAMIGNEDDVYCRPMLHFKHNYNYVTRATMYQWMNRHLELGLDDPVIEQDFVPLTEQETTVWNEQHPAPTITGIPHERSVCRWMDEQAIAKLATATPSDPESWKRFQQVYGNAWRVIFDQGMPEKVDYASVDLQKRDGWVFEKGLLRDPQRGSELPMLTIHRDQPKRSGKTIIWTSGRGKADAFDDQGQPTGLLIELLGQGNTVLLPDLLNQGEFKASGGDASEQRLVEDARSYSAFTFAYNRTLVADRCADLLTVVAHAAQQNGDEKRSVGLVGTKGSATWAAPAAAIAGQHLNRVVIETAGERFAKVTNYRDASFVPGAVKYGDLPALLALRAPHAMTVVGEDDMPALITQAYDAVGASQGLQSSATINDATKQWLLE
ncbi:MAG: acetylxylan esterase [Rubripirellula sp.]